MELSNTSTNPVHQCRLEMCGTKFLYPDCELVGHNQGTDPHRTNYSWPRIFHVLARKLSRKSARIYQEPEPIWSVIAHRLIILSSTHSMFWSVSFASPSQLTSTALNAKCILLIQTLMINKYWKVISNELLTW